MYIKNQIFKKKQLQKYLFHFTSQRNSMKTLYLKKKVALFFHLETFLDKTTFNFHLFSKVNNFVILLQYSIHFIQTRSLDRVRMEFSWYKKIVTLFMIRVSKQTLSYPLLFSILLPHWCKLLRSYWCQSQIIELEPRATLKRRLFSGQILLKLKL